MNARDHCNNESGLGLDRFQDGIQVKLLAQIMKIIPELGYWHGSRDAHCHLNRKHRCAGVRRGITARQQVGDLDLSAREKLGQVKDNAGLIEANDIDAIRNAIFMIIAIAGFLEVYAQIVVIAELFQGLFELRWRMPVA